MPPRGVDEPFARRELRKRAAAAAKEAKEAAEGEGADGAEAEADAESGVGDSVLVPIREELYRNGRVVGHLRGALRALLPAFEQLPDARHRARRRALRPSSSEERRRQQNRREGVVGGSARAAALRLRLRRAVDAADERGHQAALEELGSLLRLSHKESITCFVFSSTAELHACRDEMLGVWHEVVTALEERTIGYGCRAASYEVVTQLLRRDESAARCATPRTAAPHAAPPDPALARALAATLAWVLSIVAGRPPAAQARAPGPVLRWWQRRISGYRSRWRCSTRSDARRADRLHPRVARISSELDCAPELRDLAEVGMAERPPLDWRQLEQAPPTPRRRHLPDRGGGVEQPSAEAVAEGEAAAAALVDAVASQAWRTRLRRQGHMFCGWSLSGCRRSAIPSRGRRLHLRRLGRLPGYQTLSPARCSNEIAGGR